jgi:hypothetical protein
MANIGSSIGDAEIAIATRKAARVVNPIDVRSAIALEALADDVTRLRSEIQTIRELFAGYAARSH